MLRHIRYPGVSAKQCPAAFRGHSVVRCLFRQFLLVIDCASNYLSSLSLSDGLGDKAAAIAVLSVKRLGLLLVLAWVPNFARGRSQLRLASSPMRLPISFGPTRDGGFLFARPFARVNALVRFLAPLVVP